jgi:hypothetical protein
VKAYEEKRMAVRKADQERREAKRKTYKDMMTEGRSEAERRACE